MRALVNDPSHWLSTFKIELGAVSDAAYNNGNQQIMVVMRVQASEGAVITDDDLETLVPVELLGDGSYRVLPTMDDDVTWAGQQPWMNDSIFMMGKPNSVRMTKATAYPVLPANLRRC